MVKGRGAPHCSYRAISLLYFHHGTFFLVIFTIDRHHCLTLSFLRLKNNFFAIFDVKCVHQRSRITNVPSLDLIRVNGNRWRIVRNIKITKITNHKWNHRLSLVVRMERGRTLQLEQHCRHCQEKFDKRHRELAFLFALHSHPFSLIMWASSIMNFPSLYFWLDSNACS